ncbi:MAG: hypothetical protein NTV98_02815, partial [Candidatus Roizmanbacteria bacterium]|nr:hypothetical protein [Candidatus Roizmanbacteria bacterium]
MDIQSVFYLLASIFMILGIVVMITILLFIWHVKTSADAFQKKVKEHVNDVLSAKRFAGVVPLVSTIIKWV